MARLIAEPDPALEQRAGRRALPARCPASIASAAHAPFLSHPETLFAVSEAFCDGR
jgi:hypothetical protein